jgi:hypothetical protein
MKLRNRLHFNKCSRHFQFQTPKQLGFTVVVLAIMIPNPDLTGIHQTIKEVEPWLEASAAILTIAKVFKKSDQTLKK